MNFTDLFYKQYKSKNTGSKYIGHGIIFENVDGSSNVVPKNFKYKIRSTKLGWYTNRLFPVYLFSGPMNGGGKSLTSIVYTVLCLIDFFIFWFRICYNKIIWFTVKFN